jgi:hypothetical protein
MLHFEEPNAVLLTGLWTPLVVAVITAVAGVAIARMGARDDDLRRAERLSQVLSDMEPSRGRTVVAAIRDDYVVSWALRQAAPVDHRLRRTVSVLAIAGGVALGGAVLVGLYVGLGFGTVSDWFFWVYYGVGLAMLLMASWLRTISVRRARVWMRAERERRGLREPVHEDLRREVTGTPRRLNEPRARARAGG